MDFERKFQSLLRIYRSTKLELLEENRQLRLLNADLAAKVKRFELDEIARVTAKEKFDKMTRQIMTQSTDGRCKVPRVPVYSGDDYF